MTQAWFEGTQFKGIPSDWTTWQKPAGVMVLLAPDPRNDIHVLLIRRPSHMTHHADQIAFPGGRYESADRTLWETAVRETHEEVGILIESSNFLGYLDPVFISVTQFTMLPIVAWLEGFPSLHLASSEVAEARWMSLASLQSEYRRGPSFTSTHVSMTLPEFTLPWARIWGATARVLEDLLGTLGRIQRL